MTRTAHHLFLGWAARRPMAHQKVLATAIQDSIDHGEQIDSEKAKEIISVVDEIIEDKKM